MGINYIEYNNNEIFADNPLLFFLKSNENNMNKSSYQGVKSILGEKISEKRTNYEDSKNVSSNSITSLFLAKFVWEGEGNKVYVTGNFCEWKTFYEMKKNSKGKFLIFLNLPQGIYQYKYIVDNSWKCCYQFPTIDDGNGNINNVLEIKASEEENIKIKKAKDENEKEIKTMELLKKGYTNYFIPEKEEFYEKINPVPELYKINKKNKVNIYGRKENKYLKKIEYDLLSQNLSYKKIPQLFHDQVNHFETVYNRNNMKKNNLFKSIVNYRYRLKFTTFVYYKA